MRNLWLTDPFITSSLLNKGHQVASERYTKMLLDLSRSEFTEQPGKAHKMLLTCFFYFEEKKKSWI